jgi:hypothetical protein
LYHRNAPPIATATHRTITVKTMETIRIDQHSIFVAVTQALRGFSIVKPKRHGRLSEPEDNGKRYLKIPIDAL